MIGIDCPGDQYSVVGDKGAVWFVSGANPILLDLIPPLLSRARC